MNTTHHYYILGDDQQQLGPYTETELRNRAASGAMSYDTLVWREGLPEWTSFADCFPLPSYDPLRQLPSPPPLIQQVAASATKPTVKYPKWPWILFAVSCFFWLSFSAWMSEIENEASPYIAEYNRMNSTEYTVSAGIEAIIRGALGDPFGKANEEYHKDSHIKNRLAQLYRDYETASAGSGFCLLLTIVFAVIWIVKHRSHKKATRA